MEGFILKCCCGNEIEIKNGDANVEEIKGTEINVYDKKAHVIRITCSKCGRATNIKYAKD